MPSNCGAFDSTFERQRDFIHWPIEIWAGCLPQKWPRSAGHLLGFASRKTKIPAIPQAPRRHGYKLLKHNTSQSEYYKGAARSVLRWRKASVGLGHVTRKYSVKPPQTRKPWQSSFDTYRWLVQLKPAWQRYIASPKANHLADWAIWSYMGTPSFIGLGCSSLLFPSLST